MTFTKKQILAISIPIALLLIAIIVLSAVTSGFRNWNFNKPEEEIPENNIVAYDENGNEMYSNGVYSMSDLTFVPMAAASNVTIQATVYPSEATNKKVDWTTEWINPSSSWANGKNVSSYVTVSPSSDGDTTATVNCLQAFGEKVKITVTSRDNPLASANCTVNYSKKITSATMSVAGVQRNNGDKLLFGSSDRTVFGFTESLNYGINTLDDSFTKSLSIDSNKNFINYILNSAEWQEVKNNIMIIPSAITTFNDALVSLRDDFASIWGTNDLTKIHFSGLYSLTYGAYKPLLTAFPSSFRTFFNNALFSYSQNSGLFTVTAKFTGTYSTYDFIVYLGVADTVADVNINTPEIVF